MKSSKSFLVLIILLLLTTTPLSAWTGPTQAPPAGNTSAPLNVGTVDQVKNAGLSVNSLAVFGNTALTGNLGVGVPVPTQKLDVSGTTLSTMYMVRGVGGDSGVSPYPYAIYQEAGAWTSPYPDLRIQFHTGIKYDAYSGYGGHRFYTGWDGTNNPFDLKLQITDKVYVTGTLQATNATITNNVTAAGYFHSSDARLKSNIKTSAGVSLIEKLRGVTFDWKKNGTQSAGVIAQEVEQVLPGAVHTNEDGIKSVEYDQLIAPLIEAVKEQQAEIESLKNDIKALKSNQ